MKKLIVVTIAVLLFCTSAIAQIDRSKAPQGKAIPEINLGKIETFTLRNGIVGIVVENHKLPKVRVDLYVDYLPVTSGEKAGITGIFGNMLRAGSANYTKEQIDEESEFLGTELWVSERGGSFTALKRNFEPSLKIFSDIISRPTLNNEKEFTKLIKQYLTALEAGEREPDAIMNRVYNAVLYGGKHPYGEFPTKETLNNIQLADLKEFYNSYFTPRKSYLSFIGDITKKEAKKLAKKYFSKWEKDKSVDTSLPSTPMVEDKNIVLIDLPTSTQAFITIAHTMDFKKSSNVFFPLRLGNGILGGGSSGRLFKNIREDKGYTYGAYSKVVDDRFVGEFKASAKVRNEVVDSAIMEFFKEFTKITTEPPTDEELMIKKMETTGAFALSVEKPETLASFARSEFINKLPSGFYANYLKSMNAVSEAAVLDAVQAKINPSKLTVFVVGKAIEILPRLKTLGYPITFYDIWANKLDADPTAVKQVLGELTGMDVIEKYVEAIGGRETLESKQTQTIDYSIEIAGAPVTFNGIEKSTKTNKYLYELYMKQPGGDPTSQGMLMLKEAFDGEQGYISQMGQKSPYEEDKIQKKKILDFGIFPRLNYNKLEESISLEGIVKHNGNDVYKVKIIFNDKEQFEYYNTETYLLEKIESKQEFLGESNEMQEVLVTNTYSDYKEFNGVKLPVKETEQAGPQTLIFTIKDVRFDEKMEDKEFE